MPPWCHSWRLVSFGRSVQSTWSENAYILVLHLCTLIACELRLLSTNTRTVHAFLLVLHPYEWFTLELWQMSVRHMIWTRLLPSSISLNLHGWWAVQNKGWWTEYLHAWADACAFNSAKDCKDGVPWSMAGRHHSNSTRTGLVACIVHTFWSPSLLFVTLLDFQHLLQTKAI